MSNLKEIVLSINPYRKPAKEFTVEDLQAGDSPEFVEAIAEMKRREHLKSLEKELDLSWFQKFKARRLKRKIMNFLVSKALEPSHDYKRYGTELTHLLKNENVVIAFSVLWDLISAGWIVIVDGFFLFSNVFPEKLEEYNRYKLHKNRTVWLFNKEQAVGSKNLFAVLRDFVENHPEIFGYEASSEGT
jgi:hypothetical protein